MNGMATSMMSTADWILLLGHALALSLMSIGGAISTLPEMHRFLVDQHRWLSNSQFNASIAIAQAAPGPNVLFVALFGWNIGLNAGGTGLAVLGALITMGGLLLPSSVLTYLAAKWGHRNRELRSVRAFKQGMSPVVVALVLSTGYILAGAHQDLRTDWPVWTVTFVTIMIILLRKTPVLLLLAAGAMLGWFGLI